MAFTKRKEITSLLPAGQDFAPVSSNVLGWNTQRRRVGDLVGATLNVHELGSAFNQRLAGVLRNEPSFLAEDNSRSQRAAELVKEQFLGIDRLPIKFALLLAGVGHGLSALELVWETDGPGMRLADLIEIDIRYLGRDRDGTIFFREWPSDYPEQVVAGGLPIDPYKIAYLTLGGRQFRGWGCLEEAFVPARGLFLVGRFWSMTTERFGSPTLIGKESAAGDFSATKNEEDQVWKVLTAIRANATAKLPRGVEVELLEANLRGASAGLFRDLARHWETAIQKRVLGQTLTSDQGERGARSLGEVHERVRSDILKQDAKIFTEVVQSQIVNRILELNGYEPGLVKFDIEIPESVDLIQRSEYVSNLRNKVRIPLSRQWVRDYLGDVPEPVDEKDTLEPSEEGALPPMNLASEIGREIARAALDSDIDTDFDQVALEGV